MSKKFNMTRDIEKDSEIEEILETNQLPGDLSSMEIPLSSKYSNELLRLLIEVLTVSGIGVKATLNQHIGNDSSMKKPSSLNNSQRKVSEAHKQKPGAFKVELEKLCDEYNDQKTLRRQETSSLSIDRQMTLKVAIKIDELFFLCNIESNPGKVQNRASNASKLIKDPDEILQNVTRFIQINQEELKKEIVTTLKNSTLKLPRLVTYYFS